MNRTSTDIGLLGESNYAALRTKIIENTGHTFALLINDEIVEGEKVENVIKKIKKEVAELKRNMNRAIFYLQNTLNELEKRYETM